MNDGLLSRCVGLQPAALFVGWAKRQRAQQFRAISCWARHYRSFAQPTTLPNLQLKPTQYNPCRLGKASASLLTPLTCIPAGKAQRAQQFHYKQNQQGFSLLEIIIVMLILSIIAAIAVPNLSSNGPIKLDTAAKEVAAAIQFARAESIRTKIPRGIFTDATNDRIRIYSLPGPTYDIYHPIDKKLYDIQLTTDAYVAGVDLVSASFAFVGGFSSSTYLDFNSEGNPKYTSSGIDYMLTSGTVTLSYQGQQRIVSIAAMTGRVSIQ